jgi:hypothetical protein
MRDTLKLANSLEAAGFTRKQAEGQASAMAEFLDQAAAVTKSDLQTHGGSTDAGDGAVEERNAPVGDQLQLRSGDRRRTADEVPPVTGVIGTTNILFSRLEPRKGRFKTNPKQRTSR